MKKRTKPYMSKLPRVEIHTFNVCDNGCWFLPRLRAGEPITPQRKKEVEEATKTTLAKYEALAAQGFPYELYDYKSYNEACEQSRNKK